MRAGELWTIARRDLNGRFRGLRLLFICLFLGVATLAAIGSLTTAITKELTDRGQEILGGDIEVALSQRLITDEEHAALEELGTVSDTVRMRAMAQLPADSIAQRKSASGNDDIGTVRVLAELKGVDQAYPLYGQLVLADGKSSNGPASADQIFVGEGLVDRLNVKLGDRLRFGTAEFTITGILAEEPDRIGEGFTLGPVALVSIAGLERTGLVQPGSLYEAKYRIRTSANADLQTMVASLESAFPIAGFEIKSRDQGAPGTTRFIERLGQFLGLVGLTALLVAGIGVGNGVASYLAGKRSAIATLKVLGAHSRDITAIYLMQIATVGSAAIFIGVALGAFVPSIIIGLAGDILPVQPGFSIFPIPLLTSALYGVLIAVIFAVPPLARARHIPAAGLFRGLVDAGRGAGWRIYLVSALAFLGIFALVIITARDPLFSGGFLITSLAILLILAVLGWLIRWISRILPRSRQPLVRLAIAGLHRPGAQTGALVVALGLGLTLFVMLAAIQTSLSNEITRSVPERAPNLFALDIPVDQETILRDRIAQIDPQAEINTVPALRGTIISYANTRVADLEELPEGAWFLNGDRGLTYSQDLPQGSEIAAGEWWAEQYDGPPLVSVDAQMAQVLNLELGDTLIVSVLGREISATISSFRQVNWETLGFNYTMVFSPNALADAPHSLAATVSLSESGNGKLERQISGIILELFPSSTVVEVSEIITEVRTILQQMAAAISIAASITILSGLAVLIGAIAAARQSRIYDSVILKTLGATRRQILLVQAMEYGLLSLVLAGVAMALGLTASWYVMTQIFEFGFVPDWTIVLLTLFGGAGLTLIIGLVGSWPVLSAKPAQALRHL
ncbi:ABC transporter permease [Parasphingorhabdus sp. DH2-15]|uniref:ABC transporter permease n=1 Tax=Parasphingorhabdus sp. DH2-15 TaxID=3444112 RepID=UPI003F686EC6